MQNLSFYDADGKLIETRDVVPYVVPVEVPETISKSQLYLALVQAQLLMPVLAFVEQLPSAHWGRILWETAENYRRSNPMWDQFGQVLGLTPAAIDNLFIEAAKIKL